MGNAITVTFDGEFSALAGWADPLKNLRHCCHSLSLSPPAPILAINALARLDTLICLMFFPILLIWIKADNRSIGLPTGWSRSLSGSVYVFRRDNHVFCFAAKEQSRQIGKVPQGQAGHQNALAIARNIERFTVCRASVLRPAQP